MANCPRCGAVNQPGKAACWKCWAPLPVVPPAHSSPPSTDLAAPVQRKISIPNLSVTFPKRHTGSEQQEMAPVDEFTDQFEERPTVEDQHSADVPPLTPDALPKDECLPEEPPPAQIDPVEVAAEEPEGVPVAEEPESVPVEEQPQSVPVVEEEPEILPVADVPEIAPEPREDKAEEPESALLAEEPESAPLAEEPKVTQLAEEEPEILPVADVPEFVLEPREDMAAETPEETDAAVEKPAPVEPPPTADIAPDTPVESHPSEEFAYVAPGVKNERARGSNSGWIMGVLLIAVIAAGIYIYWYSERQTHPSRQEPQQVAQQYLDAVSMGESDTAQQLATDNSIGLFIPHWFMIVQAQPVGGVAYYGRSATIRARITLAPTSDTNLSPEVKAAITGSYTVILPLKQAGTSWQVDQRTLFRHLRAEMKRQHPEVTYPLWEGVSQ